MDVKQYFKTLTLQFGSQWWIASKTLRIPPEGYLIISVRILKHKAKCDACTQITCNLHLRPENVLFNGLSLPQKQGSICLGILDGSGVHDGSTMILGGMITEI